MVQSPTITADELRDVLADALEGAAERLRGRTRIRDLSNESSAKEQVVAPSVPQLFEGKLTLTVAEAAEVLGISRSAAYEALRRGQIPSIRLGRRILVPVFALSQRLCGESSALPV
jgi:excisionase family DNA binding protein